jgi:hypothetical protein
VLVAVGLPGWLLLLPALATVPLSVITIGYALRATAASQRIQRDTPAALRAYAPAFVVYYATTAGVRYQLGMWLPYLERLNKPYVVITRNPATVPEIAKLTKAPILVPRTDKKMSDHLDSMVVPSMKAAFYVQGSAANATFQRYRMTHVWLNHGDSDKQANYHPRHASYSKLFVSGQQGVDRYAAHGIECHPGGSRSSVARRSSRSWSGTSRCRRAPRAPCSTPRPGRVVGRAPTTARYRTDWP